jgi:hypothetical protein
MAISGNERDPRRERERGRSQTTPHLDDISRRYTTRLGDPTPSDATAQIVSRPSTAPLSLPSVASLSALPGVSRASRADLALHALGDAHAAEARRWRAQADDVSAAIGYDAERFASMMGRWQTLMHQQHRTRDEGSELARLEIEAPELSQRLARARQRWTDCVVQARTCEDRVTTLQQTDR